MPAYATFPVAIMPGDPAYALFNAETVAANSVSQQITRAYTSAVDSNAITFALNFASSPTAVVTIQGANQDVAADYVILHTSSNLQADNYTDTSAWKFYRVSVTSYSGGGALTVTAAR
jgi:hypothetical protein